MGERGGEGSRPPAGQSALPLTRGGRREVARGPRPAQAEGAVDGVLGTRSRDPRGRGKRPSGDSQAPGGRPPRPGRGFGSAGRCGQSEARPRGSPLAGSWSLDAWTPGCCSTHRPSPFRVAPARVASQGPQPQLPEDEEVGEGGWPGGWGRGLEAPG